MKSFWKLAWRNLWRNRRRTLITLASVWMAVVLAIAIRSLQRGVYRNMISNAVSFSTGYLQIHANGYWADKSINNSFESGDSLHRVLEESKGAITLEVPRLESFALASSGQHTKGVAVTGISPLAEDAMHPLEDRMIKGRYFSNDSAGGVLIGDALAAYLELDLGDTLVLLGQGYHGTTAAGQFPITGIFHYPINEMNSSLVYLNLPVAQQLFGAPGRLTSLSLMPSRTSNADVTQLSHILAAKLGPEWEVMPWPQMNRELVQQIDGDSAGGVIMLGILYLVVAFGVFGTILMMTMERRKEFAVMIAIGMHRRWISLVMFFETIIIGALGVLAGMMAILPLLLYVHRHPIALTGSTAETYQQFGIEPVIPASLEPSIFLYQGITVLVIALVSAIYPLIYVNRLPVTETLKQ